MYIHLLQDWPHFTWDQAKITPLNIEVRHLQGRLLGRMESLGFKLREEATLSTLTQDVLKTSEIEGEKLNADQVRSSIAKRLGIVIDKTTPANRNVEGIVEIMLDATGNYASPLTQERLFNWHKALFPAAKNHFQQIQVGAWRDDANGPMQVVSGPIGHEKTHFEAPSSERLNSEMTRFLKWFNAPSKTDLILKSALAHFWFVTIHPFEDGNGRIGRAIADMVLARSEKSKQRFYSMSAQIQHERADYYKILESCSKGSMDITAWIEWYFVCLKCAMISSEQTLRVVLDKAKFWEANRETEFNPRQRKVINRLLEGIEGKLSSSKWAKLARCSQDTALRDLADLVARKILKKDEAGGRSTSYQLIIDDF